MILEALTFYSSVNVTLGLTLSVLFPLSFIVACFESHPQCYGVTIKAPAQFEFLTFRFWGFFLLHVAQEHMISIDDG